MTNALTKIIKDFRGSLILLQAIAENSFDSVLITDATPQLKILYANKAFVKLTGYSRTSVIGKSPRILQGLGTDKQVIKKLSSAIKAGKKFEGRAINYKKNGTPFVMCWRVIPIKSSKKINAWIAIQREYSFI